MTRNQIMDESAIKRSLARITHEILERNNGSSNLCLLGVKRRGVPLAAILAENIKKFEGAEVPLGFLDIAKHRDDLTKEEKEKCGNAQKGAYKINNTYSFFIHKYFLLRVLYAYYSIYCCILQ